MTFDRTFRECRTDDGRPKIRFQTRRDAKAAIRTMSDTTIQPYRCSVCDHFHIGHYPKNRTTRRRLQGRHRETSAP